MPWNCQKWCILDWLSISQRLFNPWNNPYVIWLPRFSTLITSVSKGKKFSKNLSNFMEKVIHATIGKYLSSFVSHVSTNSLLKFGSNKIWFWRWVDWVQIESLSSNHRSLNSSTGWKIMLLLIKKFNLNFTTCVIILEMILRIKSESKGIN